MSTETTLFFGTNENCTNCIYCNEGALSPDLKRAYTCRRFPPSILAVATPSGIVQLSGFPQVDAKLSCGEYVGMGE